MMSGEVALLAHEAKRGLLSHPGKPLRGIRLKGKHTTFGADHDVASVGVILDARDDMDWFGPGRRFGGSRGWGFGRTFGAFEP